MSVAATADKPAPASATEPDDPPAHGAIGTAVLDERGDWQLVDESLCGLLGHDEQRLLATQVAAVLHPEDLARERVRLEQLLGGGLLTYRAEARLLHADGHALWALLDGVAVPQGAGARRCLVQLQEITRRKHLELGGTGWALTVPNLSEAPLLVAIKDLAGRYLRVNAAFEEMFSVDGARLAGRPDEYLFEQSVAAMLRARDAQAAEVDEPVGHLDSLPQREGARELASLRFALRGATGQAYAVCVVWSAAEDGERASECCQELVAHERQARAEAHDARSALLTAEMAQRAGAALARERLLERTHDGAHASETPLPFEAEDSEQRRLLESERLARQQLGETAAQVQAAKKEVHELLGKLEGECADRAEADAEVERLRRCLVARTRELEAEREPASQREAEVERLRAEARERQDALVAERAAHAQAQAEVERLRAAERAAGLRVPLPALAPEPVVVAAADDGPDDALTVWRGEGQARLTWALAEASALHEGARAALAVVGETLGWDAAGFYCADDASGELRCSAFWQGEASPAVDLETVSWQASFRPGSDVVGRVRSSGEAEWMEDLSRADGFGRARAAKAGGLHSMVVIPIASRDETLGVVELFCAAQRPRDEGVLEALTTVALQLGQFMMRSEAESLRSRYGLLHR